MTQSKPDNECSTRQIHHLLRVMKGEIGEALYVSGDWVGEYSINIGDDDGEESITDWQLPPFDTHLIEDEIIQWLSTVGPDVDLVAWGESKRLTVTAQVRYTVDLARPEFNVESLMDTDGRSEWFLFVGDGGWAFHGRGPYPLPNIE